MTLVIVFAIKHLFVTSTKYQIIVKNAMNQLPLLFRQTSSLKPKDVQFTMKQRTSVNLHLLDGQETNVYQACFLDKQ